MKHDSQPGQPEVGNDAETRRRGNTGTSVRASLSRLDPLRHVLRLHHDQRGSISVATLFVVIVLTLLLLMIANVGRHADDKLKLQHAADAAAYSGGVTLARGMNSLAFSNHLMCEVFAITAFLREGRDRNAEQFIPDVLAAWDAAGEMFEQARFEKFARLGPAIRSKVPLEQEAVSAFGEEQAAAAELYLPVFELILREQLIPEFERTCVRVIPELSQETTREIARRHGRPANPRSGGNAGAADNPPHAVLWRAIEFPVGAPNEDDPRLRTLPAVDPDPERSDYRMVDRPQEYLDDALKQRRDLAKHYLELWNRSRLDGIDSRAPMSQFGPLWRIATCAQLDRLLNEEYPLSNLPFQIRRMSSGESPSRMRELQQNGRWREVNRHLDRNHHFLTVVYRAHLEEMAPGFFKNPLAGQADSQAFAQLAIYLPLPRFRKINGSWVRWVPVRDRFGNIIRWRPIPYKDNWPTHWDLLNQNWTVRLVPATLPNLGEILARSPAGGRTFRPAPIGNLPEGTLAELVTH